MPNSVETMIPEFDEEWILRKSNHLKPFHKIEFYQLKSEHKNNLVLATLSLLVYLADRKVSCEDMARTSSADSFKLYLTFWRVLRAVFCRILALQPQGLQFLRRILNGTFAKRR